MSKDLIAEVRRLREVFREYYVAIRTMAEVGPIISSEAMAKKMEIGEEENRAMATFVSNYARARDIEEEMGVLELEPLKIQHTQLVTCIHCGKNFHGNEEAKAHVAVCDMHPAVIRAVEAERQRDFLASTDGCPPGDCSDGTSPYVTFTRQGSPTRDCMRCRLGWAAQKDGAA